MQYETKKLIDALAAVRKAREAGESKPDESAVWAALDHLVSRHESDTDKFANAKSQARAQFESIREMVQALRKARKRDDWEAVEEAERAIHEDALSVEVRSGWYTFGNVDSDPAEFRILLCTGGPAVQIVGTLSEHREPESATIQYQDWFTPWVDWDLQDLHHSQRVTVEPYLLEYARCFYFGD